MSELLRANRAAFVDRLVTRVVASVPQYAHADAGDLRRNIDDLFGDLIVLLEEREVAALRERFVEVARSRIEQGFAPSDFVQAVLLAAPVMREVLRDKATTEDLLAVEEGLHEAAAVAASVYAENMNRRLKAKNQELDRVNALLTAQEKLLSIEAMGASRALAVANEFNRRVIESLNSGLMVIDSQSLRVTLFTRRAEEILGIAADKALGREVSEALAGLAGLDLRQLIGTVRSLGQLPLTKLELTLPSGRQCSIYVRAQRMFDADGAPRGTVVVFDDPYTLLPALGPPG